MPGDFSVGLTHDFLTPDGRLAYPDIGLDLLDAAPGVRHRFMDPHGPTLSAEDLRDLDVIVTLAPRCTRETLKGAGRLLAIARFGVGYDTIDVPACTERDVLLMIAKGAVDHSIAESIVAWMLALCHRVPAKDRLMTGT